MGEQFCCSPDIHGLCDKHALWGMVGKKVALVGEANLEHDPRIYTIIERLKSISGFDMQETQGKYRDSVYQRLPVKILLSFNELPRFFDASGAFSSRLLILRFNKSFASAPDILLLDKLLKELPGDRCWALEGLTRLNTQGHFTVPKESIEVASSISRDACPVLGFLQDCCVVHKSIDPGDMTDVTVVNSPCIVRKDIFKRKLESWGEDHDRNIYWNIACADLHLLAEVGNRQADTGEWRASTTLRGCRSERCGNRRSTLGR